MNSTVHIRIDELSNKFFYKKESGRVSITVKNGTGTRNDEADFENEHVFFR